MKDPGKLLKENQNLRTRLDEAEELLQAFKLGTVDAFVTDDNKIFTLKSADHAYRVLVETINEGAATLAFDGTVMYCNNRLAAMLGFPSKDVIGNSIYHYIGLDELSRFKTFLRRSNAAVMRAEFRLKRKNRTFLPVLISCNSLKLDEEGLCMVITDLTEQKQVEFELKNHREHLEELVAKRTSELRSNQVRLSESDRRKDEFLATLAHELRNPLAPIRNAAHVLATRKAQDSESAHACDIIEKQVAHMVHLVDDLLNVSRIERGEIKLQKKIVDFALILSRVAGTSRSFIEEKRQALKLALPDHPLIVNGDPTRLEQVVGNLLNNASKYTPTGGTIHLRAAREGRKVILSIRDEGIGIAPKALKNIFELFFQVDSSMARAQGGLGIGLTLVRHLVHLHGGTVTASSAGLGQGSEFVLALPFTDASPIERGGGKAAVSCKPRIRQKHILVIDDNESILRSMKMLLYTYGFRVSLAKDGETGIQQALTLRPDIALVDLGLPGLNGLDTAGRIRAKLGKTIVLIALSGYARKQDKANVFAHGFDRFLAKPVNPQELVQVLNTIKCRKPIAEKSVSDIHLKPNQ